MKKISILMVSLFAVVALLAACGNKTTDTDDLASCAVWFDGCNTCTVVDGELAGCTRKACPSEVMEEPYCMQTLEDLDANVDWNVDWEDDVDWSMYEGCALWFDGCNDCTVADGNLSACTQKACFETSEPYCKKSEQEAMFEYEREACEMEWGTYVIDWNGIGFCLAEVSDAWEVCEKSSDCESLDCVVDSYDATQGVCYDYETFVWCQKVLLEDGTVADKCS